MDTIGELLEFLGCFDPGLPLKVLTLSGPPDAEVVGISAMGVVEPVVVRSAGVAAGVWLVARTVSAEGKANPPVAIVIERSGCGCAIEVPVVLDRPVATWAIECEHSPSVPS